jgi:hypothetical protein
MSLMLANRYFHASRFDDAVPELRGVLDKHPRHSGAARKLMVSLALTGRVPEAVALAVRFLAADPEELLSLTPNEDPRDYRRALAALRGGGHDLSPAAGAIGAGIIQLFIDPSEALVQLDRGLAHDPAPGPVRALRNLVANHVEAGHV